MFPAALLEAALKYEQRGWAVFPLRPRGKEPLTRHGFKNASTSEAQICQWWSEWPDANIGLATRKSGLVVVDVDTKEGKKGAETLARLVAADVDTPNYVVAPPSIHPDTGRAYAWALDRHPDNTPIASLPQYSLTVWRKLKPPEVQRAEHSSTAPGWLGLVFTAIVDEVEAKEGRLRPDANGGMVGRCPLHDDRSPSFSTHPQNGWKCFAGCGHGRLTLLAHRLGISLLEHRS